jgi:hypothetical protein
MATDTFTDSNGVHLHDHSSEGVTWTDTTAQILEVQSNAASAINWQHSAARSDSTVDVSKITILPYNTNQRICACVRMTDANDTGYSAYFITPSGGNWTGIELDKGGVWTGNWLSLSYSQASNHVLKVTASGTTTTTVTVYCDGNLIGSVDDSTSPYTSGNPGIYIQNDADANSPYIADWTDEASAGGNSKKINIGDAWKDVSAIKINIGDTWKTVSSMKINIGDAWKTLF